MTLIDRLLLARLARVLRLLDPVPASVREDALRAGRPTWDDPAARGHGYRLAGLNPDERGGRAADGPEPGYSWDSRTASAIAW